MHNQIDWLIEIIVESENTRPLEANEADFNGAQLRELLTESRLTQPNKPVTEREVAYAV